MEGGNAENAGADRRSGFSPTTAVTRGNVGLKSDLRTQVFHGQGGGLRTQESRVVTDNKTTGNDNET